MTKFMPATIEDGERLATARAIIQQWQNGRPEFRAHFKCDTLEEAVTAITAHCMDLDRDSEVFVNDTYQVLRRVNPDGFVWLSIKRLDREAIHDWRDMQEIKNQLIGPECEAVELYPAESRLCDSANQYHLWGSNNPKFRFPFGFTSGRLVMDDTVGKSVNRKLNKPT